MRLSRTRVAGAVAAAAISANGQALTTPADLDDTEQFTKACQGFAQKVQISNSTFVTADFIPAGTTLQFPNVDPSCSRPSQLVSVPLCRVQANITTSSTSGLHFEAWLPQNWTGRFLSTGNGGLGGCVQYDDVEWTASLGFAAVATNNGHDGMSGLPLYQKPEVVEDFAYRAIKTGVVVGKDVSKAFYGKPHTKSYYLGCSTGGRQGMKMVQDFPDLFDGVSAGAPAMNFNNLNTWSAHFRMLTGSNTSDTFVSEDLWDVVHKDMLSQCDALDGHVDGILEAPDLCRYKADKLLCDNGAPAGACLAAKQVNTVNEVFSDMKAPNGTVLYPRMQPGSEAVGAFASYYNGQVSDKADWIKYVVMADPNFDLTKFTPDLWAISDALNPFDIATTKADISAFRDRGGKLIHYHGTMDAVISSDNSPRYYESVRAALKQEPAELDAWYRFFRVSGMGHCSGGPGAHFIGNQKKQLANPDQSDQSVLMDMVRWVEEDKAPEFLTGTALVNNTQGGEVVFTRRHCRWPTMNKFMGGDANSADSWSCVAYNATT
ncbi:feruloyl esterase B-2 [Apiospora rasikravindrae]|uniref:Carboxylic ester hydrolase n=1 Tax=Apiospora rasikravindrae TaxID=990691 RepID=A0ABR1U141_9PEZI